MGQGMIMKALSGFYYVQPDDKTALVQCRARGVFKKKGITPLVGDRVIFAQEETGEGTVLEVLDRSSVLLRPPIANADTAVLVFSLAHPSLNLHLLDKFLVHTEYAGLHAVICFSKADLPEASDREVLDSIERYQKIGYQVILTSQISGQGVRELAELLADKIAVFAGQSGVGKSSLLNLVDPTLHLETGEISHKLGRGRHTTRHVELLTLPLGGLVADTPGFSQLDFADIEAEQLSACFKEFRAVAEQCKFRGCLHRSEPGCGVLRALHEGSITPSRYEHYRMFVEEIRERKRRY